MTTARGIAPGRAALGNGALVRSTLAYLTNVLAEEAVFVGALVYAFQRQGAGAAGVASIALLLPNLVSAPIAGAVAERHRADRVRQWAYMTQVVAAGCAALAAYASAPVLAVVGPCALGVAAGTFVRPASAVLLPAIVRSSRELTVANLWVGHCESVAVLGGPLVATVLLALDGAPLVLAGCAALVLVSVLIGLFGGNDDLPAIHDDHAHAHADTADGRLRPMQMMRDSLRTLRARPGATAVLAVAGGQYVLVGGLDLLFVVLAGEALDLGDAGAGVLAMAFGFGALMSAVVATVVVRRPRLAPTIVVALAAIAAAVLGLGAVTTVALALVLLPVLGCSRSLLDLTSRMLLQRSAPPSALAAVFAVLEFLAAAGMIIGSIVAQVLIAVAGVEVALVGLGVVFAVLLATTRRSLRVADDGADVPVVAISLLRRLAVFAPLPPLELEAVARSAIELPVRGGDVIVREGEEGDRFYAVADGRFRVAVSGRTVGAVRRGGGFGEVALLADIPRTATVTAEGDGQLLAIERAPFLLAVTGSDAAHRTAWTLIRSMTLDADLSPGAEASSRRMLRPEHRSEPRPP